MHLVLLTEASYGTSLCRIWADLGVGHGDVVLFEGPQDTSKSRILQQLAVVCALPESLGGRNRPVVVVDVFAQWDTHVLRRVIGAIVRTCHANSQTGTDGTDSNSDHNIDQIINDIMQHISILQVFELQDILQAVKDVNLSQTGLFVFDGVDAHFWRRRRRKEDSIIAQELLKALASRYASNGNNYENSVGMVTALSATIRFKRNLKLLQRKGYCDSTVFERNVPMQRAVSLRVLLRRVDGFHLLFRRNADLELMRFGQMVVLRLKSRTCGQVIRGLSWTASSRHQQRRFLQSIHSFSITSFHEI